MPVSNTFLNPWDPISAWKLWGLLVKNAAVNILAAISSGVPPKAIFAFSSSVNPCFSLPHLKYHIPSLSCQISLGVLAFGSLKVISPIQQIYNNWALIKSREAGVKSVLEILNLSIKKYSNTNKKIAFQKRLWRSIKWRKFINAL